MIRRCIVVILLLLSMFSWTPISISTNYGLDSDFPQAIVVVLDFYLPNNNLIVFKVFPPILYDNQYYSNITLVNIEVFSVFTRTLEGYLKTLIGERLLLDIDDVSPYDTADNALYVVAYMRYNDTHIINLNKYLVDEKYALLKTLTSTEHDPSTWSLYVPYSVKHERPYTEKDSVLEYIDLSNSYNIIMDKSRTSDDIGLLIETQGKAIRHTIYHLLNGNYSVLYSNIENVVESEYGSRDYVFSVWDKGVAFSLMGENVVHYIGFDGSTKTITFSYQNSAGIFGIVPLQNYIVIVSLVSDPTNSYFYVHFDVYNYSLIMNITLSRSIRIGGGVAELLVESEFSKDVVHIIHPDIINATYLRFYVESSIITSSNGTPSFSGEIYRGLLYNIESLYTNGEKYVIIPASFTGNVFSSYNNLTIDEPYSSVTYEVGDGGMNGWLISSSFDNNHFALWYIDRVNTVTKLYEANDVNATIVDIYGYSGAEVFSYLFKVNDQLYVGFYDESKNELLPYIYPVATTLKDAVAREQVGRVFITSNGYCIVYVDQSGGVHYIYRYPLVLEPLKWGSIKQVVLVVSGGVYGLVDDAQYFAIDIKDAETGLIYDVSSSIKVYVNNTYRGTIDVTNGSALLVFSPSYAGVYAIKFVYLGGDYYNGTYSGSAVTIWYFHAVSRRNATFVFRRVGDYYVVVFTFKLPGGSVNASVYVGFYNYTHGLVRYTCYYVSSPSECPVMSAEIYSGNELIYMVNFTKTKIADGDRGGFSDVRRYFVIPTNMTLLRYVIRSGDGTKLLEKEVAVPVNPTIFMQSTYMMAFAGLVSLAIVMGFAVRGDIKKTGWGFILAGIALAMFLSTLGISPMFYVAVSAILIIVGAIILLLV